jgi:mono/diheme cytochrome c family protein
MPTVPTNKANSPWFAIAQRSAESLPVHTRAWVRIRACLQACRNRSFTKAPSGAGGLSPAFSAVSQAVLASSLLLIVLATESNAQQPKPDKSAKKPSTTLVARGKYLVEDVAMCGMCHTPRDSSGNLDRSRWLEGAPLWLQPSVPVQDWPLQAPRIAGSPPGSDAELITLLTTGSWKTGQPLRPPMPQFRMTREDAAAVVAYLRSLSPVPRN